MLHDLTWCDELTGLSQPDLTLTLLIRLIEKQNVIKPEALHIRQQAAG